MEERIQVEGGAFGFLAREIKSRTDKNHMHVFRFVKHRTSSYSRIDDCQSVAEVWKKAGKQEGRSCYWITDALCEPGRLTSFDTT